MRRAPWVRTQLPVRFVNCFPGTITLRRPDGSELILEPDAALRESLPWDNPDEHTRKSERIPDSVDGLPVDVVSGSTGELPPPQNGVFYLVPPEWVEYFQGRRDVFTVNTRRGVVMKRKDIVAFTRLAKIYT